MKKEKIALVTAVISACIWFFMTTYYVWLIMQNEIQPVLTTWILFCVAVSLSFRTYWSSKKHSVVGNIGNFIDLGVVWLILLSILLFGKNINFAFNTFETCCLVASLGILLFWKLSKQHMLSNIALQVIITVAYFPTIYRLWYATQNTESFSVWSIWLIGVSASLATVILHKDTLGIIYSSRAFVLVLIIMILMLRIMV